MLNLAKDLRLPLEGVTESLGFLGRKGSGKSYTGHKLAEEMYRNKVQFVAIDPVGIWWGLRLAADGKKPGLPVPVFGGLHGDIPLEPHGGALIADLVVDRGISIVLDVSQFESDTDKARFARDFANRFFFKKKAKPSAVHVFLEECQEFVPQNPQREEAQMLHAFTRMAKIGRNFGIGMSLISQRPQEVNKKVLNLTELLFCFQLTGPQERKTIEGWIAEKGIDEDIAGELPKLSVGHPHVWSPAWLKISKVIAIEKKWTFDASSTPKVGKSAAARELSPIDLKELAEEMSATIERAKAEDPKLLRQRIAELERAAKQPAAKRVEVPVLEKKLVRRLEQALTALQGAAAGGAVIDLKIVEHAQNLSVAWETINGVCDAVVKALRASGSPQKLIHEARDPVSGKDHVAHTFAGVERSKEKSFWKSNGILPPGEHATLKAVLQYPGLERGRLSVLTGYKRSSRDAYVARLVAKGYINTQGQELHPTQQGTDAMPSFEPLPTGSALAAYWQQRLPEGERKTLEVLMEMGGDGAVPRDRLDDVTGYKRSSRDAYLARMKARGIVIFGARGMVRASPELFD